MTLSGGSVPEGMKPGGQPSWVAVAVLILLSFKAALTLLGYLPPGI